MLNPQFILPISTELVVDLFAGGGGASTGIEQAIGRHVDIAVNHDPQAVSLHQVNHPQTEHHVSNVWEVDPRTVTAGQRIGLLWASPDCTYHSKARGGKPHRDRDRARRRRGLASVVVKWVRLLKPTGQHPRVIALENVEEFRHWGPLLEDGTPCPQRRGQSFERWVAQLHNLGYQVEWREMRGCDYGAPTIRKRLFLVARCDGQPIVWPEPTHGAPDSLPVRMKKLKPWPVAADCIDWSVPCPSIFERQRPLAEATMRRIAKGIQRYVIQAAEPFIVPVGYGERDSQQPRTASIHQPLGTAVGTAKHALVAPTLVGIDNASSPSGSWSAQDPLRTTTTENRHAVVAAFLAQFNNNGTEPHPGRAATVPLSTVTTTGSHQQLVASTLVKMRGDNIGSPADSPLHTISAGGTHHAEVHAFLQTYYGVDQDTRLQEPLPTVTTRDRFAIVMVKGQPYAIVDIGLRMLTPRELYRAQGFPADYIIDHGADGKPLTKTAQVRMCGNSVCPPLASALVAANYSETQALRAAA